MRLRSMLWLVLVLAMVAAACGDDDATTTTAADTTTTAAAAELTQSPGVLLVGSDIPFPPFEDYDGDTVIGFDADLINEIASRLGLTAEWVATPFDTIFTQLATGQFDVVASATTITPARSQQVNFTVPYYKAQQALTVNTAERPDINSVDDLGAGDRIAVQSGTTGADWAAENLAPWVSRWSSTPRPPIPTPPSKAGRWTEFYSTSLRQSRRQRIVKGSRWSKSSTPMRTTGSGWIPPANCCCPR
jgi:ABC-type amino acid transport substrate-binding protein